MIGTESKRWIRVLVFLLAIPGLMLLMRDLGRPSPDAVIANVRTFDDHVRKACAEFRVDLDLVRAVIAAESKGDPDARSRVGALGLMQLMPETGRECAERIGLGAIDEEQLLQPGVNIRCGTSYLRAQLDSFEDDVVLALAAYNAGPTRVRRWVRTDPGATSAEVLERHGFAETRAYVQRVLGYVAHQKSSHRPAPES